MASAQDTRALLDRIGVMERALLELQGRADQATPALQAMQAQQQQTAASAQQAQRRAAAAQTAGIGASAVVDTLWCHRQSHEGSTGTEPGTWQQSAGSTWTRTRALSALSSTACL